MKWIFAVLVALNLVVFGSTIIQKMVVDKIAEKADEKQIARTVVVQQPPAPVATAPLAVPNADLNAASASATASDAGNDKDAEKKSEKTPAKPADKKKDDKKPAEKPAEKAVATETKPKQPKNCGGASVVLKENDYHRIKGLLAQWPNAASPMVQRNTNASKGKSSPDEYLVFVPMERDVQEQMMGLASKSFNPREENGMLLLGKFHKREDADNLRRKAMGAGIPARVLERMGDKDGSQALSMTVYNVAFLKIDDNDAKRLNEILKPYAPLKRYPCKK